MSIPLAIVGASTRSAAASGVRAGFQPLAADLFADADLRRIATATRISPYPEGLVDWLRAVEPPAWMYTGALENYPELVDQMAWIAPLWGNPGDTLQLVRSPLDLVQTLKTYVPETRTSPDGLPQDGSWLAKTYSGASGSGVRAWESPRSNSARNEIDGRRPTYYQRRILGIPAAAIFVAADGYATLLGITRQLIGEDWLGAHGFQYAGSIGPLPISNRALAELNGIGSRLAAGFELSGLFGVDFILDDNRVWVLEVNPRYTASVEIIERVTGLSAIEAHVSACTTLSTPHGSEWERALSTISTPDFPLVSHGKAILFARRDLTITPAFAEWSLSEATRTPWPTLADVSSAGTVIDLGRPILTVFAEGATSNDVEQHLRRRVAEIEQKLYAD